MITNIQDVHIPGWAFEQFKRNHSLTDLQTFAFLGIICSPINLWPVEFQERMAEKAMQLGPGFIYDELARYLRVALP